jgi:hypothetical protein
VPSPGILFRVDLVITDVSEERIAYILRVTIGELGATLTVTSFVLRSPILVSDDGGDTFVRNVCV